MKKYFFLIFFILYSILAGAQQAKDFAIPVKVVTDEQSSSITLSWPQNVNATSYIIKRKTLTEQSYSTEFSTVARLTDRPETITSFNDRDIIRYQMYEYEITGTFSSDLPSARNTYICAGIKIPVVHNRGTLILLCDNTITAELSSELNKLYEDLVGDGWKVKRIDVARSDNPQDVPLVKNKIINVCQQNPDARHIFIIGHVPVPYAGMLGPDGHTNHFGAWAADGYYGDIENTWTDLTGNDVSATRLQNRNVPGDGKFDQSSFTSVQLGVGRIDFSNMPAFAVSETALLRRYLSKDHLYKTAGIDIKKATIIEDNFSGYSEQFSQSGWKSGAANVGYDNVMIGSFDTVLTANNGASYLWAYGCGSGLYDGAWGIAFTTDFAAKRYHAVFTEMFGSYFGDWDSQNNLMRAAVASNGTILTCVWSGRPHWFFHNMSIGLPVGYAALLAMNNHGIYTSTGTYPAGVHTSLMGDPSLRNSYVKPASGLVKNITGRVVNLNWQASAESKILGYNIYRSNSITGDFILLNQNGLVNDLFFADTTPLTGKNVYLVKTVKLDTIVANGLYTNYSTYQNSSLAVVDSVFFSSVVLPVSLLSFTGQAIGCNTSLHWKTSNEINIKAYEPEYSATGHNFLPVKHIPAALSNAAGNNSYECLHTAAEGNAFYRLKIIENNGSFHYSQQLFLSVNCLKNMVQVYPVPVNDVLYITIPSTTLLSANTGILSDASGKQLQKITLLNGTNTIDMSGRPNGVYSLALTMDGVLKNYKIVK